MNRDEGRKKPNEILDVHVERKKRVLHWASTDISRSLPRMPAAVLSYWIRTSNDESTHSKNDFEPSRIQRDKSHFTLTIIYIQFIYMAEI